VTKPPSPLGSQRVENILGLRRHRDPAGQNSRDFLAGLRGKAAAKPEPSGTGADMAIFSKTVRHVESDPSRFGNPWRSPTFHKLGKLPQSHKNADVYKMKFVLHNI
jgi:hypothetical protein